MPPILYTSNLLSGHCEFRERRDEAIMDLLTRVYHLGGSLGDLQSRFEEEYHSDFSFLLTSLAFGMRKALLLKFAVIKKMIQKGTDTRLQESLEKVSPDALRA